MQLTFLLQTGIITVYNTLPRFTHSPSFFSPFASISHLLPSPSLLQLTSFISPLVFVSCLITFLAFLALRHCSISLATVTLQQPVQLHVTSVNVQGHLLHDKRRETVEVRTDMKTRKKSDLIFGFFVKRINSI